MKTPDAVKKVFNILEKSIDLWSLNGGHQSHKEVSRSLSGTIGFIGFYSTFKNIIFWVDPFNNQSLDKKTLAITLKKELNKQNLMNDLPDADQDEIVQKVMTRVLRSKEHYSQKDVKKSLHDVLLKRVKKHANLDADYSSEIEQVVNNVIIKKRSCRSVDYLTATFFTVSDFGTNLITLNKWNVINYANFANKVGQQSKIFSAVVSVGITNIVGGFAAVGLTLTISVGIYDSIKAYQKWKNDSLDPAECLQGRKDLIKNIIKVAISALELTGIVGAVALPGVGTVPFLAIAITAKSIGLVQFFAFP